MVEENKPIKQADESNKEQGNETEPKNQVTRPKRKSVSWLVIILLVIILALIGVVSWLVIKKPVKVGQTATPTATAATAKKTATKTAVKTANPYSDWKTYKSDKYGIQFKYPASYPDATEEENDVQGMIPVEYTLVKLSDDYTKSVDLSNTSAYSDQYKTDVDQLISNYNGTAEDMKPLWLPPGNAAIQASTVPEKYNTPDDKWRGIYYFATIGNGYSTKLTAMVVLTDGAKIVQFAFADNSDKSSDYPCVTSNASCSGDQVEADAHKFWDYVNTLKNSDSETVMKNFRSTYKKIVNSLEAI